MCDDFRNRRGSRRFQREVGRGRGGGRSRVGVGLGLGDGRSLCNMEEAITEGMRPRAWRER